MAANHEVRVARISGVVWVGRGMGRRATLRKVRHDLWPEGMNSHFWCSLFRVPCGRGWRVGLWLAVCATISARMDLAAETYTFITFAGSAGYSDGTGNAARFFDPTSVAADRSTHLYVAEFVNHVVRKISLSGTNSVVTTLAGLPGVPGTNDVIGTAARVNQPTGVSVRG